MKPVSAAATETADISPRTISRWPWWGLVGLVYLVHLGLIFWLGQREPTPGPLKSNGLSLALVTNAPSTWRALGDPTLFALPHINVFSGPAWMMSPALPRTEFSWSEPPRWLELAALPRAPNSEESMPSNGFSVIEALAASENQPRRPNISEMNPLPQQSTWQLSGDLARRRLLTPLQLNSQYSDDLLTNSVVRLLVDASGWPYSMVLLPPGSGSKDADEQALELAEKARFDPLPGKAQNSDPLDGLTWGELVFQWHTIPPAATNATRPQ